MSRLLARSGLKGLTSTPCPDSSTVRPEVPSLVQGGGHSCARFSPLRKLTSLPVRIGLKLG
eukprot:scaffold638_cov382-Prasinococcus_capsulatus_cf.AAC.13